MPSLTSGGTAAVSRRVPHAWALIDGTRVRAGLGSRLYLLRADDAAQALIELPAGFKNGEPDFRFPWADEDDEEPGGYADPHRRVLLRLKVAHGASCRGEEHYLKYERRSGTAGSLVPVLSCRMCGVYWAAEERGNPSPAKAVLIATALVTAADQEDSLVDAEVLRAAAVHVMRSVPGREGPDVAPTRT